LTESIGLSGECAVLHFGVVRRGSHQSHHQRHHQISDQSRQSPHARVLLILRHVLDIRIFWHESFSSRFPCKKNDDDDDDDPLIKYISIRTNIKI
jgi:hypothetical protein